MFSLNPAFDRTQPDASPWDPETFNNMLAGIDPVRMELYDYCSQHDIAITVMKAYGGGDRLLDAEKSPLKVALTRDQCVAYALAKPCVAVSLCSASNANQLDEYLHYLKATDAEKDYNAVLNRTTAQAGTSAGQGECTYCKHCAPCPAGIDIAAVNKLLAQAELEGSVSKELAAEYAKLKQHAGDCLQCGVCEDRCPFEHIGLEFFLLVLGEEAVQCVGDGCGIRFHDIAYFPIGDDFRQAADIGHQHRFLEVEGDLGDAALRGGLVGLCHDVGRAEVAVHLAVGDEVGAEHHAVLDAQLLDLVEIR